VIQTLQRICALLAVADTELPFSWMAARCLQKLRAYCTRPATDLRANIGLCPSGIDKSADAALDGANRCVRFKEQRTPGNRRPIALNQITDPESIQMTLGHLRFASIPLPGRVVPIGQRMRRGFVPKLRRSSASCRSLRCKGDEEVWPDRPNQVRGRVLSPEILADQHRPGVMWIY
jgi:hypothetical protein